MSPGTLSKFGAGLFLLVQVIILLDFTHSWNDAWVEKDEQKWSVQIYVSIHFHCYSFCLVADLSELLGLLLCWLCQLDATFWHLHSQGFCSFGSIPLAMTVVSISSSLS